ncbi:hypothetical protein HNO88_000305 [Novosphingobium chloroacetimidivorans]|uniref:Uncharacterized protein n=1 Tax=Novosphingobium chloroacetimidivorans TaxID=1428314 RepID=A0A7W7K7G1_9SPHN|nr:packaged DNA stabilization gp4 family protein [Novosphingobium chloroacetimidivorans]MBB4857008.1 hypothetical protein [Novosphingobium chloroacetimidivorans]
MTTKRQLIEQMFVECGVNGWEYDIQPEEKQKALTRLDALMAELAGRGMALGYNAPDEIGGGDLDDELGVPDQAFYGLAVLGAERLSPTMGKTQSVATRQALTAAMKAVRSAALVLVPDQAVGNMRVGSGNRWWFGR